MALIPCANCGKPISQHARACPTCHTPTGKVHEASNIEASQPSSAPSPPRALCRPPLTKFQIARQVFLAVLAVFFAIVAVGNYSIADSRGFGALGATFLETRDADLAAANGQQEAEHWRSLGAGFGFASAGITLLLVGIWIHRSLPMKRTCPACQSRLHPQATICKFCRTALPSINL